MARRLHRRSRLLICLLPVLALAVAPLVAQRPSLRLVSTVWPPFTNEVGQTRLALDLVELALDRAGFGMSTTIVEAGEFTSALVEGAFDGSAAAWKDAAREQALVFSEPYLENRLVLVARKGADVSATTLQALGGRRVAIVGGYSYGDIDAAGPIFVRSTGDEDSLRRLLDGGADYALIDELVLHYIVEAYAADAAARLEIGTTPLVTRSLHLAVRRTRPDAEAIVSRFNLQLRAMIADRSYHRLLRVDWLLADADGDGVAEYVPSGDRVGADAPSHVYTLVAPTGPNPVRAGGTPRFYLGGHIYEDWVSVPDRYKVDDPDQPDSRRSTGTIFTFSW